MISSKTVKLLASNDVNIIKNLSRCKSAMASTSAVIEDVKSFDQMPQPRRLPVLGHLHMLMPQETQQNMHKFAEKLQQEHGDIVRLAMPGISPTGESVWIFRPEDVQSMYSQDDRIPKIPGFGVFEHMRHVTLKHRFPTAGIIVNTEDWYTVRSLTQQDMMRPKSASYYTREMEDIAKDAVEFIGKTVDSEGCMNVNKLCQQFALETVAYIFLGSRLGTLHGEPDGLRMIEIADESGPLNQQIVFMPKWSLNQWNPLFKRVCDLTEETIDICEKHLNKALANLTEDSETMIAKLVRSCGKDSGIPLIMSMDSIIAGIDTTGSTASFLLYHLATNPDKQEILYKEICDVIGPQGQLTESSLAKMKYMKAVQMESQRILPAVWGSSRVYDKEVTIGGYNIPRGTAVIRAGVIISTSGDNFKDPLKFLPERWLRGHKDRHTSHSFANIPFGHGSRSCIGQRFARLELYSLMVKLVQSFKLEYAGEGEVGQMTSFVSVPDRQIKIKFTARS